MDISKLFSILKNNGQRITQPKKIILEVLLNNMNKMMSVQEIKDNISVDERIDDATIYRNVLNFLDLSILDSMIDEKGVNRYKIEDEHEHHHHLICVDCGHVINIECNKSHWDKITDEKDFTELYHNIEIYGKCKECHHKPTN